MTLLPLTPPAPTVTARDVLTDALAATVADRRGFVPALVELNPDAGYVEVDGPLDAFAVLSAIANAGHLDGWSVQVEPWRRPETTHRVVAVRVGDAR